MEVCQKLSGHNPQSEKTLTQGWRAGARIYFDGLHYCTADTFSLFKYISMDSTVATRKTAECQPVWSTATLSAASDLTAKSLYNV